MPEEDKLRSEIKRRLREVKQKQRCPYCEAYLKYPLSLDLDEEGYSFERARISKGYWATIEEILKEKTYTLSKIWSLAEKRDKQAGKELNHFWIITGPAHFTLKTAICCELATLTSEDEALEFEEEHFVPEERNFRL